MFGRIDYQKMGAQCLERGFLGARKGLCRSNSAKALRPLLAEKLEPSARMRSCSGSEGVGEIHTSSCCTEVIGSVADEFSVLLTTRELSWMSATVRLSTGSAVPAAAVGATRGETDGGCTLFQGIVGDAQASGDAALVVGDRAFRSAEVAAQLAAATRGDALVDAVEPRAQVVIGVAHAGGSSDPKPVRASRIAASPSRGGASVPYRGRRLRRSRSRSPPDRPSSRRPRPASCAG